MRLLKKVNYRGAIIRIYLNSKVQHICKTKLPNESTYVELSDYPRLDTIPNLIRAAKAEIDEDL